MVEIIKSDNLGKLVYTNDGSASLIHPDFEQAYHSMNGAKKEAQDLYISSSGFLDELESFHTTKRNISVLDVGLGLGYNALTTVEAWMESSSPRNLTVVSLESNRELFQSMRTGEALWQSNWPSAWLSEVRSFGEASPSQWGATLKHPKQDCVCTWVVLLGDACQNPIIPQGFKLSTTYDYIWQDPFSPEMNPNMWSKQWFSRMMEVSNPQTKLMTYSVSRPVKDALKDSGWFYSLIETTTSKRSWLQATSHRS